MSGYGASTRKGTLVKKLPTARSMHGRFMGSAPSDPNPFGAMMADEIFQIWEYPHETEECASEDYYEDRSIPEEEYWYQTELDLETNLEREEELRRQIERFKRAHRKMYIYALQWHYLQDEMEDNPQLTKMFNDMQMIRKLQGSDRV